MKLPNGYGSVSKVNRKNLRKKYIVRITTDIVVYCKIELVLPHLLVIRCYAGTLILPQAVAYYSVHTWYV